MSQANTLSRPAAADWRSLAPLAVLLVSVVSLGSAFVAQYGFGLQPCVLCIYQRWPYAATIAIGLLASLFLRRSPLLPWALALAGLLFAVGAGIAAFHVGVEHHWWQGTAECTGTAGYGATTVEALRAQLKGTPIVRCDEVQWSLFGISMAGYNFLASGVYAIGSWTAAWRLRTGA